MSWINLVAGIMALMGSAASSFADPFCAVRLSLQSKTAQPVMLGNAVAVDGAGNVAARVRIESGQVEFCDLDFGTYTIRIDALNSYSTDIVGIEIWPDLEQHLTVVINDTPNGGDFLGNACRTHFRVVSPERKTIPGATLTGSRPYTLSENGFATGLLRNNDTEEVTARAPGYLPRTVKVQCNRRGFTQTMIVLQRE